MTEEVRVYVTSLDQWRHVLFTWFDEGYSWIKSKEDKNLHEGYFNGPGGKVLNLEGKRISWSDLDVAGPSAISYTEFMERYGGNDDVETYYVTSEQMELVRGAHESRAPASYLVHKSDDYDRLFRGLEYDRKFERDLLRYLGGDRNVRFQEKDPLYLLKGKDSDGSNAYFTFNLSEAPTYTYVKSEAFKAPREEIMQWYTPFWMVEPVKEKK